MEFELCEYRRFSWKSESRTYGAAVGYDDETTTFPLHLFTSDPPITWSFDCSSPPTRDQLRAFIQSAEKDVAFHLKFAAHLMAHEKEIEYLSQFGAVSHFLIGPVVVFLEGDQLPVMVRGRTTDYEAIRSALRLIEDFKAQPDDKLKADPELEPISTDLDLE